MLLVALRVLLVFFSFISISAIAGNETSVELSAVASVSDVEVAPPRRPAHFDLSVPEERAEFRAEAAKLLKLAKLQKAVREKNRVNRFPYEIKSGGRKALERVIELSNQLDRGSVREAGAIREIQVLMASYENNLAYPIKKHYQILPEVPYYLIKGLRHPTIRSSGESSPDPTGSSFWQPKKIEGMNLRTGFGRDSLPDFEKTVCTYVEPKSGWGAHPGFTVNCGGKENVKFKLGDEIYSGPFNTRIFWALGYNVTAIDPVRELKVAYDRRLLSEFHSRRHLEYDVRFLFLKIKKLVVTNYEDPFVSIRYARLKDGQTLSGSELKKRLFRVIPAGDPKQKDYQRPEEIRGNFREELERQISYLAFVPGAMAADPDGIKAIGPWKYEDFDTAERREVRAVQLLSAWVGNFNMRWENTRLSYVKNGDSWELKHFFSDVGSGLGESRSLFHMSNSEVKDMAWSVTEPARGGVKLSGFVQNSPNAAFDQMSLEDARWILKRIASLSEKQLADALSATGMSPELQSLALKKLISRRAHMIRDFGL